MKRPDTEICAPPLDGIRAGGQGNGYPAPSALSGPRLDHEHRALNGNVAGAVQGHLARLTWSQVDPAYGGGAPSWRLRSSRAYFAIGHFLRGFEQVQRKEGRFERSVRCSTVIPHGFLRSQNYRCASIQQRHLPLNLTSRTRRFTIGGISTARFGVGCVAVYPYGPKNSWATISVGGDKWDEVSLLINRGSGAILVLE
jgi:hypothetical protein